MQRLEQEAAQLQELNADLLQDKQEALLLLDAYRCSSYLLPQFHACCPTLALLSKLAHQQA